MSKVTISQADWSELREVVRLYSDICDDLESAAVNYCGWGHGYYPTRSTAEEWMKEGWLYLMRREGALAGCIALTHKEEPGYREGCWKAPAASSEIYALHTVTTHPAYRGQGLSRHLISFAKEQGRKDGMIALRLDVCDYNAPAIALYEQEGFSCVGKLDLFGEQAPFDLYRLYEFVL